LQPFAWHYYFDQIAPESRLKIRPDSITWYENGKLRAYRRSEAGKSLLKTATLFSVVGLVLASALNVYVSRKFQQPLVTQSAVLIWGLSIAVPALIVVVRGLLGRSLAVTDEYIVRVELGSKVPLKISYDEIEYCELRKLTSSGESIGVLDVFGSGKKLDELELPGEGEASTLIDFLKSHNVQVRSAS
jgi:hypothetical protein